MLCTFSGNPEKRQDMLEKFRSNQKLAEIYYVYHSIQRYTVSGESLKGNL